MMPLEKADRIATALNQWLVLWARWNNSRIRIAMA
jgi:hypothetical protein